MHQPMSLIRIIFVALAIAVCTALSLSKFESPKGIFIGIGIGIGVGVFLLGLETLFKRLNLKSFNVVTLGLVFGYFLGDAMMMILGSVLPLNDLGSLSFLQLAVRSFIFLTTCYIGIAVTTKSAEEIYLSIPFIRLNPSNYKKKDLLIDSSALSDSRLLDLATTGLLDQQVLMPRCLYKEFQEQIDSADESVKLKARRSIDAIKKLEAMPFLEMRYTDIDCSEVKEPVAKILKLANLLDANILTTDIPRSQQTGGSGPIIININTLSRALKPLSQTGEQLSIKIQRYGKEPRQGVGYLDDGTMVVVNGGAQFIGSTIKTQVLSAKLTTSGRMIFCNALGSEFENEPMIGSSVSEVDSVASNYFSH